MLEEEYSRQASSLLFLCPASAMLVSPLCHATHTLPRLPFPACPACSPQTTGRRHVTAPGKGKRAFQLFCLLPPFQSRQAGSKEVTVTTAHQARPGLGQEAITRPRHACMQASMHVKAKQMSSLKTQPSFHAFTITME